MFLSVLCLKRTLLQFAARRPDRDDRPAVNSLIRVSAEFSPADGPRSITLLKRGEDCWASNILTGELTIYVISDFIYECLSVLCFCARLYCFFRSLYTWMRCCLSSIVCYLWYFLLERLTLVLSLASAALYGLLCPVHMLRH